jgi:hypothetical protein
LPQELTPEQRDYVVCQRARHAVEDEARANRLGHVRFQELRSVADRLAAELDSNRRLRVHLNPIRAWALFMTPALLDEDASLPAAVLLFAVGNSISTAVLEPTGRSLVQELAACGPCTLDEWADRSWQADRDTLVEFCRDLAGMGLVAFA